MAAGSACEIQHTPPGQRNVVGDQGNSLRCFPIVAVWIQVEVLFAEPLLEPLGQITSPCGTEDP